MRKLLNVLYVTTPEAYLTRDGENIVIKVEDEEKFRVPCAQQITDACGEQHGERPHRHKELRAGFAPTPVWGQSATRCQKMDMRMIKQLTRPRVQDCGECGKCTEVAGIASDLEQGFGAGME